MVTFRYKDYLIPFLLTVVSPLLGLMYIVFLACWLREEKEEQWQFWMAVAFFFSIINVNQIWESDTLGYTLWMKNATKVPLGEYLMLKGGQELIFFSTNYIYSLLTDGWKKLYLLIYNVAFYYFFIASIYKLGECKGWSQQYTKWGILLIFFFITYFTGMLQLMRQALAGVMIVYIMIEHIYAHVPIRRTIIYSIVVVLIHTSAALPLSFLLLPGLASNQTIKKVALYLLYVTAISSLFYAFPNLMGDEVTTIGTIARRSSTDVYETGKLFTFSTFVVAMPLIASIVYSLCNRSISEDKATRRYMSIILLWLIFLILLPINSFVQMRFAVYNQFFLPSVILLATENEGQVIRLCKAAFLVVILLFFFIYLFGWYGAVRYCFWDTLFSAPFEAMDDNAINVLPQ